VANAVTEAGERKMIVRTSDPAKPVCADNGLEPMQIVQKSSEQNLERVPNI